MNDYKPTAFVVPFADKDAVKALGARWNPSLRAWCAQDDPHAVPEAGRAADTVSYRKRAEPKQRCQ